MTDNKLIIYPDESIQYSEHSESLKSRRNEGLMIKKLYRSSCKVPVILVRF